MPEYSNEEIHALVQALESTSSGNLASAALIGCGPKALGPLRDFLILGKPRGLFHGRQLAVETLAQLGGKDALLEYLQQKRTIADPAIRFSEAVVESTAARVLCHWPTDEVYSALKKLSETRLLPGLVETLSTFRRAEMVPYFLYALGDDECREQADKTLRDLGQAAHPALIEAVNSPNPSIEDEIPSSRIRRRRVLRMLADSDVNAREWESVQPLASDADPEIATVYARMALRNGSLSDQQQAVATLIDLLPRLDWFLRTEVRATLAHYFDVARDQIETEIARRSAASGTQRATDLTLRILVNLRAQEDDRTAGVGSHAGYQRP